MYKGLVILRNLIRLKDLRHIFLDGLHKTIVRLIDIDLKDGGQSHLNAIKLIQLLLQLALFYENILARLTILLIDMLSH